MNDRLFFCIEATSIHRWSLNCCRGVLHYHGNSFFKKIKRITALERLSDIFFCAYRLFFCLYQGRAWYKSFACLFHFVLHNRHSFLELDDDLFYQSFFILAIFVFYFTVSISNVLPMAV